MKTATILSAFAMLFFLSRQPGTVSKGQVFGTTPDTTSVISAYKVEAFMGAKVRITTSLKGKIIKVIKSQGGWFTIDAGNGKIIAAHFKVYKVSIPSSLAGHNFLATGVVAKQFIADDMQHFAGDTVTGKKQHAVKTNPKQELTFEVSGLKVE
jgi:hypothetical protein